MWEGQEGGANWRKGRRVGLIEGGAGRWIKSCVLTGGDLTGHSVKMIEQVTDW